MARIGRLWAGKLFGTNTGNLAAEFDSTDTGFTGKVRFMDDQFGPVVYEVTGTFDGTTANLSGNAIQAPSGVQTGTVTAEVSLTPEGHLRGQWSTSMGTGGPLILFPHDAADKTQTSGSFTLPEQLHVANRTLGAIRLYLDDLQELIGFLRRDFAQDREVVVTYVERGNQISKYARDFLPTASHVGELRYIKLVIQEPEAYGINRYAQVELNATGENEVRVQGVQESWVIGKAEAIASHLRSHQKTLVTSFRKYGLNINGALFLIALVLLPELPLARRFAFLIVLIVVLAIILRLHTRFIPNVAIYLSDPKPGFFAQAWPQILSWLIAASAALFAAIVYGLLSGQLPFLTSFFSR